MMTQGLSSPEKNRRASVAGSPRFTPLFPYPLPLAYLVLIRLDYRMRHVCVAFLMEAHHHVMTRFEVR